MLRFKHFFINGNKYIVSNEITIMDILIYFNYNTSLLVLEHNHLIRKKETWDNIYIKDNDIIEIVTIVGGG